MPSPQIASDDYLHLPLTGHRRIHGRPPPFSLHFGGMRFAKLCKQVLHNSAVQNAAADALWEALKATVRPPMLDLSKWCLVRHGVQAAAVQVTPSLFRWGASGPRPHAPMAPPTATTVMASTAEPQPTAVSASTVPCEHPTVSVQVVAP